MRGSRTQSSHQSHLSRVSLKSPQFVSFPTQSTHKSWCPVHAPCNFQISKGCVLTPRPGFYILGKGMKSCLTLDRRVHGIVDSAKATIDTTAQVLSEEDVEIFVLIDRVQAFAHPLTAKLVLTPKAVVGLTTKSDDAVPLLFLLEESRCSLIVCMMFDHIRMRKPMGLVRLKCLSQFRFDQTLQTFT